MPVFRNIGVYHVFSVAGSVMVGLYRLDVDLTYSKLRTANSVSAIVICVYDVVMKPLLTYFAVLIPELRRHLLVLIFNSQFVHIHF